MVRACLQPRFNVTFVPHCARKPEAKSLSHGANFHPPPQNKKTLIRKLEQPVHSDQSRDRFPVCSWTFSLSPLSHSGAPPRVTFYSYRIRFSGSGGRLSPARATGHPRYQMPRTESETTPLHPNSTQPGLSQFETDQVIYQMRGTFNPCLTLSERKHSARSLFVFLTQLLND